MQRQALFTQEELEDMRRYDAEVESQPITWMELIEADRRDYDALPPEEKRRRKYNREYGRLYRAKNHDKVLAYRRDYWHRHRDTISAQRRANYAANKNGTREKTLAYCRHYRAKKRGFPKRGDYKEVFPARLRREIKSRGLTNRALARMSGVTDIMISKYLNKTHTPQKTNIEKLANALGVSVEYLIGGEA